MEQSEGKRVERTAWNDSRERESECNRVERTVWNDSREIERERERTRQVSYPQNKIHIVNAESQLLAHTTSSQCSLVFFQIYIYTYIYIECDVLTSKHVRTV
jgi:hypothetical protein